MKTQEPLFAAQAKKFPAADSHPRRGERLLGVAAYEALSAFFFLWFLYRKSPMLNTGLIGRVKNIA